MLTQRLYANPEKTPVAEAPAAETIAASAGAADENQAAVVVQSIYRGNVARAPT